MNREHLLMAAVALVLAVLAITAGLSNRDGYYRWSKIGWIDRRWGRTAARIVYAVGGLVMALIAALILSGWSVLR